MSVVNFLFCITIVLNDLSDINYLRCVYKASWIGSGKRLLHKQLDFFLNIC